MPDFLLVNLPAPNHSSVNFDPAIHEIVGDIYEEDLERDVRDYEPRVEDDR
jgi:hypothetical protein